MNCYIISYDLKGERDYAALYSAIKSYSIWAHITESTWAVVTEMKASDIRNKLMEHTDQDDAIFVVRSGHGAAWNNVLCTNNWLKQNL